MCKGYRLTMCMHACIQVQSANSPHTMCKDRDILVQCMSRYTIVQC